MTIAELKKLHEKIADRRRNERELVSCSICGKKISKWSKRGKQDVVECLKCKPEHTVYPASRYHDTGIDNIPYGSLPSGLLAYLEDPLPLYPSNVKFITENNVKYTAVRIMNMIKE